MESQTEMDRGTVTEMDTEIEIEMFLITFIKLQRLLLLIYCDLLAKDSLHKRAANCKLTVMLLRSLPCMHREYLVQAVASALEVTVYMVCKCQAIWFSSSLLASIHPPPPPPPPPQTHTSTNHPVPPPHTSPPVTSIILTLVTCRGHHCPPKREALPGFQLPWKPFPGNND